MEHSHGGRAAVAIETGTSNYSAALLIRAGLASRVAVLKAISDCGGTFVDYKGLRKWLTSDCVVTRQREAEWPTPQTAHLWGTFARSFEATAAKQWTIQTLELAAEWEAEPPRPGGPVRVFYDSKLGETVIYSVELDRLGTVVPAFSQEPAGVLAGAVSSSTGRISAEYLGPSDFAEK